MPALPQQPDPDRVRGVTANFFFWQGLRWVPVGAALVVVAGVWSGRLPLGDGGRFVLQFGSLALALWLSGVAGRWYARHYGRVRGIPGAHARRDAIKWMIVYPALLAAMLADGLWQPPVSLSCIVFGASLLAYRHSTGGGRRHYVALAAMMVLLGLLPLAGVVPAGRAMLGPFMGVLGAVYVIGGLLDHRELTRLLPPVAAEDDARAV